ncbi:MAG TPA: hypothetical protein PKH07_07355 [bacterium]|nr:hypothetical protein [bacterium]
MRCWSEEDDVFKKPVLLVTLMLSLPLLLFGVLSLRRNVTVEFQIDPMHQIKSPLNSEEVDQLSREKGELLHELTSGVPPDASSEPTPSLLSKPDIVSDLDRLAEKTDAWRYRSFYRIGEVEYGQLEDMASKQMIKVVEGGIHDEVIFTNLNESICTVVLGEASRSLALDLVPEQPTETPLDADSPESLRFSDYRLKSEPTMRAIFSQYTPKDPNSPLRTPPTSEEVETAAAAYYATVRPTVQAAEDMPELIQNPNPSEGLTELEEWVDTFRSVQLNLRETPGH